MSIVRLHVADRLEGDERACFVRVPANFYISKKKIVRTCWATWGKREGWKNMGEVSNLTMQMVDDFDRRIIKRTTVSITGDEPPRPRLDLDGF